MAGLIGVVTNSKMGLYPYKLAYIDINWSNVLKIKKIPNFAFFTTIGCAKAHSELIFVSIANVSKEAIIKRLTSFVDGFNIYAKEDDEYLYLTKNFGGGTTCIFPLKNDNVIIEVDYINDIPSNATDVAFQ